MFGEALPFSEFATEFTARRIKVFPCHPTKKLPLIDGGFHKASADPDVIRNWVRRFPNASIGIPTGATNGIFVLDSDCDKETGKPLGEQSLQSLDLDLELEQFPALPTPSGGLHRIFRLDMQNPVNSSVSKLGTGLDTRGDGGYVIAYDSPESYLADDLHFAPDSLLEALREAENEPNTAESIEDDVEYMLAQKKGSRNVVFANLAFWRIYSHADYKMPDLVKAATKTGLTKKEISAAIDTAKRKIASFAFDSLESKLAKLFIHRNRKNLLYTNEQWFTFQDGSWSEDKDTALWLVTREIDREIRQAKKPAARRSLAQKLHKVRTYNEVLDIARIHLNKGRHPKYPFDADATLRGIPDGILDLKTGETRKAYRSDYILKTLPFNPDPDMDISLFHRFVNDITEGNVELVDYIYSVLGYCLTSSTVEQKMWIFYGVSGSGKSTLINLLHHCLGDYATSLNPEHLIAKTHEPHSQWKLRIRGRSLLIASEMPEKTQKYRWNLQFLNGLVAGDPIVANLMRENDVEFIPGAKLLISANDLPDIDATKGLGRRIVCIPFNRSFRHDPDEDLMMLDKLKAIAPGVLAFLVDRASEFLANGSLEPEPSVVKEETEEYMTEGDSVKLFFEEAFEITHQLEDKISQKDLYDAYKTFCVQHDLVAVQSKALTQEVQVLDRQINLTKIRVGGSVKRGWVGIRSRVDDVADDYNF